jgi:hypothetical protein
LPFLRERPGHEREHDAVPVRERGQPSHRRPCMSPMMLALGPQGLERDRAVAGRRSPRARYRRAAGPRHGWRETHRSFVKRRCRTWAPCRQADVTGKTARVVLDGHFRNILCPLQQRLLALYNALGTRASGSLYRRDGSCVQSCVMPCVSPRVPIPLTVPPR